MWNHFVQPPVIESIDIIMYNQSMSDGHEKFGKQNPNAQPKTSDHDIFTEDHIEHLADLISEDDSCPDQEKGPMSPADLDDTGRFDFRKT